MSSLKIIAPINYFYDNPRFPLPDLIELDTALTIRRSDHELEQLREKITKYFQKLYSKADIEDLKNCRFYASYLFDGEKESVDKAKQKIHHVIETLRVVRPNRAACFTFLFSFDEHGELKPEGASSRTSSIFLMYGEPIGNQHFKKEDEPKIKEYFSHVMSLYNKYGGMYNRILNAFIFFQLGYLTHNPKLRIVPFTVSLESLFNTSESEVGYSLKMRSAAFLGGPKEEKEGLIEKVKVIYEVRSHAVHGSRLPKYIEKDPIQANEIWRDAEDIARRCLQKIFNENLIDIFSSSNKDLSKYLDGFLIN